MSKYVFNVVDGDPDNKVWEYPLSLARKKHKDPHSVFSRRCFLPECKNQLSIGSCVGVSGSGVVSDKKYQLLSDPSAMWIYKKS